MIADLLTGLGLVAVIEGLVLALAPLRFEDLLDALRKMSVQTRRNIGLVTVTIGVMLVWLARFVIT
ncbi:MAG: DUF2065 domain-containing protein [Alphaproteobacteria bacterium]|nr:DUF2065 domain-containing protein [Alphaproteobacteria bacterium]